MSDVASKCAVCQNPASMMCQRCTEGYCSCHCQYADWNRHKYYCIPMPPLVPLIRSEMSNRRRLNSLPLKENLSAPVDIVKFDTNIDEVKDVPKLAIVWKTCFDLPVNEFFECFVLHIDEDIDNVIWVIEKRNEPNLKKIMEYLSQCFESNALESAERVSVGELYIAVMRTQVHRVEVLEINSQLTDVLVRLIDCGKKIKVKWNTLYTPKPKMAESKAFAVCIKIQREHVDIMVGMVISLRLIGTKNREGILLAQVKPQDDTNEGLLKLLKSKRSIRLVKLSSDARLALVQISSPDEISDKLSAQMEDQKLLYGLKMNAYISTMLSAHTTNGWRRAFLIDRVEEYNTYLVYEVDEGHISICNEVKGMPNDLRTQPQRVFAITINGKSEEFNTDKLEKFGYLSLQMLTSGHENNLNAIKHKCMLYGDSEALCEVTAFACLGQLKAVGALAAKKSILNGERVHITHVVNYAEVYVNKVETKQYAKLFAAIVAKCPHYKDEKVMVGDIVLVEASEGGYFRAEIILLAGDKKTTYNVFDVDTGKSHSVPYSSLRKTCDFVSYLPMHLLRVKLSKLCNVPHNSVPENSQALYDLKRHVDKDTEFEIQFQNSYSLEANLLFDSGIGLFVEILSALFTEFVEEIIPDSAAGKLDKLILTNTSDVERSALKSLSEDEANVKSLPPSPPDSPEPSLKGIKTNINTQVAETIDNVFQRFTIDDVEIMKIPSGDKVQLILLDSSNFMSDGFISAGYFANKTECEIFEKHRAVEASYGECPPKDVPADYMPNEREICMAQYAIDDKWYRAICLQRKGNDAEIKFLDYGNLERVSMGHLLPIPKDMLYSSYVNSCFIKGYEDKKSSVLLSQQLIKSAAFWKVTVLGNGTYQLQLPDENLN